MIELVIVILALLNVFQFVYWSKQVQKLVDKLMSRNYAEYVQVSQPPLPTVQIEDDSFIDDQDVLQELNGMVKR